MREPNAIETIDYLKFIQTNSLKIDNKKYLEETQLMTLGPGVIYTKYGLLHENWVKTDNWEELCDFGWLPSYWQGHTSIDVGVTRYHGYESQVKSDIQYYNKDYIEETFTGYARDTKCYQMVCHGGDDYGEDEWYLYTHVKHTFLWWTWWTWEHLGTITPSEIENLWYTESGGYYYINVYPTNAIIFAMVCHGFYDNPSSMAHAWYDDGAEAFVSAIISIPVVGSDDFNYAFWEELCDNGGTVESATVALCDYYNTYLGSGWNYGDEWRILGNEDATEP